MIRLSRIIQLSGNSSAEAFLWNNGQPQKVVWRKIKFSLSENQKNKGGAVALGKKLCRVQQPLFLYTKCLSRIIGLWSCIRHFRAYSPHLRGSSLFFMLFSTDTGVLPTSHFESFGEDDLCFGKLPSERILHRHSLSHGLEICGNSDLPSVRRRFLRTEWFDSSAA